MMEFAEFAIIYSKLIFDGSVKHQGKSVTRSHIFIILIVLSHGCVPVNITSDTRPDICFALHLNDIFIACVRRRREKYHQKQINWI